ncbi:MAG: FG-GAP repeat domain-containing protein [Planctomycetota bacterium]
MTDLDEPHPGRTLFSDSPGLPSLDFKESLRTVIPQMQGWPVQIGGIQSYSSFRGLVFSDLNLDGDLEIVVANIDQKVYAWEHTGELMPGYPVPITGLSEYPPSVADLEGDGDMEIAVFTRGFLEKGGRFYLLDHEGNVLPGFPLSLDDNNVFGSPTLYDLDNDGSLEVLVPERSHPLGYLHIFEADGSEWGGNWPLTLDHVPACTAAVGDLDGDEQIEIVFLTYTSIYVIHVDGTVAEGWPRQIEETCFSYQSPALADLDFDGDLEIVVGAHKTGSGFYVFHHDATLAEGWPKLVDTWTYCAPTVVDLDRDGKLEIIGGRAGVIGGVSPCFWVWSASGETRPGFPYISKHGGGSEGPITVADINNDGFMEIFADHNMISIPDGNGWLFGVDHLGRDLPGFPLRPKGYTYLNGAAIDDVDGDGDYELGVISYRYAKIYVNLYDVPGQSTYHPSRIPWGEYHQGEKRGGLHHGEDRLHFNGYFGLNSDVFLYLHDARGKRAYLWATLEPGKFHNPHFGWLLLNPNSCLFTLVSNEIIPSSEEIVVPLNVQDNPALKGMTFYFQGLTGNDPARGMGTLTNMLARTIQ